MPLTPRPAASRTARPATNTAIREEFDISIVIDAATDLSAEAPRLDVLRNQRTGTVLLAHAAMQVLENAQPSVEADQIDQFEWPHRVIETQLQRLVDVARGGNAFHQHEERFVADARVHSRG